MNKPSKEAIAATSTEIELDVLSDMLGFHLRIAQLFSFRTFTDALNDSEGITPPLFAVLVVINKNPGISQLHLSEPLSYNKATIVSVTQTLEKRGLLTRKRDPADRRFHALYLTKKGEALVKELKTLVVESVEKPLAAALSKHERKQLINLLKRVYLSPQ